MRELFWPLWSRPHIFIQWGWFIPFCLDDFTEQYKRRCKSAFTLFLTYFSSRTDRFLFFTGSSWLLQRSFRSSFFHHLFIPHRPTGPRSFKVRCLIPAVSFAIVFFHVRTHGTRAIFLAVIKLLETHRYSRLHSCISFLLNVTGQSTICNFAKKNIPILCW